MSNVKLWNSTGFENMELRQHRRSAVGEDVHEGHCHAFAENDGELSMVACWPEPAQYGMTRPVSY